MAILATLPLTCWYAIPFPVSLGYALVLFFSAYTVVKNKFRVNVFPISFWFLFLYVYIMWIYNNNFHLWSLFPPGGWQFFLFILGIIGGVIYFDIKLLSKYMRWVVLISAVLFWIQFLLMLTTGSKQYCFVPNLTGAFTYEGMTYSQLIAHHLAGERPCSIFMEPSYMAYYYIVYLILIWFYGSRQYKWLSKEALFVCITLIALKSGSGIVGLAILIVIKMLYIFWISNVKRRFFLVLTIVPVILGAAYIYIGSEEGQKMLLRSNEFSTEGSSGYTRAVGGYLMFESLSPNEKLVGITDAVKRFSIVTNNGNLVFFANGVQTILLSLGFIGAILFLFYYLNLYCKVSLLYKVSIIILLVMGMSESCYLNSYMIMLTIIPSADFYNRKQFFKINHPKDIGKLTIL